MGGMIPNAFIDDLLQRVDIVELINRRVPLRKAGREYQACCPFHDEKTPSFTVSPAKQFYHCFGCGMHGTAIGFMMEYERLNFPEAIEALADYVGVEVPREEGTSRGPDHGPLYKTLEHAANLFVQHLRQHADAPQAIAYLKDRGLSGEIAARYQVGFAPPGWDNLLSVMGKDGPSVQRLRDTGLITQDESGSKRYDRFRERIMFPIRDARGRVIGFGGRVLGDGKPKYLNSPETPVFHKGRELYGLYEAKQDNKQLNKVLVVEGYMDVIALAQFGFTQAVATLGTATTPEHLERLYRATPEVVFCFDGDRAGRDAAWKALNTALPLVGQGRQARFLFLPDGEDPDTLVRKLGADGFRAEVDKALPLSEFMFGKLKEQVDMTTLDGRARLAELAKPLLEKVPPGPYRDLLEQHLSDEAGLVRAAGPAPTAPKPRLPRRQDVGTLTPIRRAFALLLRDPTLASGQGLSAGWRDLEQPGIDLLREVFDTALANPEVSAAILIERWRDERTRSQLGRLATLDLETMGDEIEQFRGALAALSRQAEKEQRRTRLGGKLRPSDLTEEQKAELRTQFTSKAGN